MKRAVIGGFLSLLGSLWSLAALLVGAGYVEQVTSWYSPPGRFGTALAESGMVPVLAVGLVLLALGLAVMGIEYFRKGD